MCERCEELRSRALESALAGEPRDTETIARAFYEVNLLLDRVDSSRPIATVGRDDLCLLLEGTGDLDAALMAMTITLGLLWAGTPPAVRVALRRTIGELGSRIETGPWS